MLVTQGGAAARRVGADLGDRQRRRDGGARDREGARGAGRSSPPRATPSSPVRASSAPTPTLNHEPEDVPARVRELTGGGAHVVCRARRRGDLGAQPRLGRAGRQDRRLRRDLRARTRPRALNRVWWRELTILGSTMGTPGRLRAAPTSLVAAGRARPVVDARLPARRGGGRPRAARARRAVRQDRPARSPADRPSFWCPRGMPTREEVRRGRCTRARIPSSGWTSSTSACSTTSTSRGRR